MRGKARNHLQPDWECYFEGPRVGNLDAYNEVTTAYRLHKYDIRLEYPSVWVSYPLLPSLSRHNS